MVVFQALCQRMLWMLKMVLGQKESGQIHGKEVYQRLLNKDKPCLAQKVPKLEIVGG